MFFWTGIDSNSKNLHNKRQFKQTEFTESKLPDLRPNLFTGKLGLSMFDTSGKH